MSGLNEMLREAHRLRRFLRDLQTEIDRAPRVLKARQTKLAQHEEQFKAAQDGLKKMKTGILEKESRLKATHQQLEKFERQLLDTANNKEYEAKKSEIADATRRGQELEEEILSDMAEVEARTANLPEQEAELKKARAEFAAWEVEAKAKLATLNAEKKQAEAKLKSEEDRLPTDIRVQYQRVVAAYGADALAEVKDKTCQQCRTGITVQELSDLMAGRIVFCKSCGRALYLVATASG